MTDTTPSPATTLLLHDGELADVRKLLEELGTPFVERRGLSLAEDRKQGFRLVIATPQRMLNLEFEPGESRPTQIAICDSDSKGLRNSLHRAGIQLMVRRPVHPAALRGLVLHALYRGPEKRRNVRVSVGAPVSVRAGWRQRPAILADLSVGGCRLLTPHGIESGKSITLLIPAQMSGSKAFSVKGRVLRRVVEESQWYTVTAQFEKLSARQESALRATIKAHASGPATFDPETAAIAAPEANPKPQAAPEVAAPRMKTSSGNGERRQMPRKQIERPVIALDEEATRVLMGRDISLGGMRVNPSPLLVVGRNVRLAIHVGSEDAPLVVTARVHRDDGDRGVVLRFHELEPDSTRRLNQMLDVLPVMDPSSAGAGMIVSEILAEAQ